LNEAYILRSVLCDEENHPHILVLLSIKHLPTLTTNSSMYLVFDYAHNRDLATHVLLHGGTDKQLTNEQIRTYVSQLLSATVYCHDRLVYHCAIELKHLLITQPGQLKLANFEYAKHAVRPTMFIDSSDVRMFTRRHLHE
jgi:serine/threonine protein kinase